MRGKSKEIDQDGEPFDLDRSSSKQFRASIGAKRLSGRAPVERQNSFNRQSLDSPQLAEAIKNELSQASRGAHRHSDEGLIAQVSAWLKQEKARRIARKAKRKAPSQAALTLTNTLADGAAADLVGEAGSSQERRGSNASDGSIALRQLESILEKGLSLVTSERPPSRKAGHPPHRVSPGLKLRRLSTAASSDTEYVDGDALVPSCDVVLDNSKTLAYAGGGAEGEQGLDTPGRVTKDKEAWATFKFEILRLAHTLRLKGWRRIPSEMSGDIEVERLSGALTNAVYVVSPPKHLPPRKTRSDGDNASDPSLAPRNPPP